MQPPEARRAPRFSAALLSIVAVATCFGIHSIQRAEAATQPQEPEKSAAPSQQPPGNIGAQPPSGEPDNQYGPTFAYIAWNLFLQAMAPANGSLTFETWTEQCQLNANMIGCPSVASVAGVAQAGGKRKVRMLH
ncbi:MAG: hypothetical protein JO336_11950 [Acidobacteriia bacterium]|nr:hypothetical protein [Terriglobia bacterium]